MHIYNKNDVNIFIIYTWPIEFRELYDGSIAHELQEHYPDLVIGEKDGNELQRVNYTDLIAILINDIKRMKRDLAKMESKI